uniref:AcidPPc domain-containing protein n=1 Tax=Globodera pallida TaxID=36090 RepID=A0A183CF20_GLOPA
MSKIKVKILETALLVRAGVSVVFVAISYLLRHFFAPTQRGFFREDMCIRHSFKPETIQFKQFNAVAILATIFVLTLGEFAMNMRAGERFDDLNCRWYWRQRLVQMLRFTTIWLLGMAINTFFLNLFKQSVGSLRPYFVKLCEPVDIATGLAIDDTTFDANHFFNNYTCSNSNLHQEVDARHSFYSGHASSAFFFATFLVLYIHARILPNCRRCFSFFFALYALPFGAASFVTMTRLSEHRSHSVDIVFGALAGIAVAVCMVFFHRDQFFTATLAADGKSESGSNRKSASSKPSNGFDLGNYLIF